MNNIKSIILAAVLATAGPLPATVYYLSSSSGSDAYTAAQDPSTPWQSLDKVNSLSLSSGDSVLFRTGDTWRGALTVNNSGTSGNRIYYGMYGSIQNPVFKGSIEITGWALHQGNIYVASVTQDIHQLFLNEKQMTLARHPNAGYFTIDDTLNATVIQDIDLNAAVDWTGAIAHVRSMHWTLSSKTVTAFGPALGALTLAEAPIYGAKPGWGYFLNNHLGALDAPGEWYYDAAAKKVYLQIPTGDSPAGYLVEGSVDNVGITIQNKDYITISGFQLLHYADMGIYAKGSHLVIENNNVEYANGIGINIGDAYGVSGTDNVVTYNTVTDAHHYGIIFSTQNSEFSYNTVQRTGILAGLGKTGMGDNCCSGRAVNVNGRGNYIHHNRVDSTAYIGIGFDGENTTLEYNFITYCCLTVDDGAGIYTWSSDYALPGAAGSVIRNNIILYSIGAPLGTNGTSRPAEGIYMDDRTHDVLVENNTTAYCANNGIFLHNTRNVTVRNNVSYDNGHSGLWMKEDYYGTDGGMRANLVTGNVFYALAPDQYCLVQASTYASFDFGTFDTNYYCNHTSEEVVRYKSPAYSLAAWQALSGQDASSKTSPSIWPPYKVTDTVGSDFITNGTFDTDRSSWSSWPAECVLTWEADQGLDNGCLKVVYNGDPASTPLAITNRFAVTQGKQYLLSFSVISNKTGHLGSVVRMSGSPYTSVGLSRTYLVTTQRRDYQVVFTATLTEAQARVDFTNDPVDSMYWLDNVHFYEVAAEYDDPRAKSRLFYNASTQTTSQDLTGAGWQDLSGAAFSGNLSLPPFTSVVLVRDPSAALHTIVPGRREQNIPLLFPMPMRNVLTIPVKQVFVKLDTKPVINIYDLQGKFVARITSDCHSGTATWDGNDQAGRPVPDGIYQVRVTGLGQTFIGQVIKVK